MTFDEFMNTDVRVVEIASIIPPCEECDHLSCEIQREDEDAAAAQNVSTENVV